MVTKKACYSGNACVPWSLTKRAHAIVRRRTNPRVPLSKRTTSSLPPEHTDRLHQSPSRSELLLKRPRDGKESRRDQDDVVRSVLCYSLRPAARDIHGLSLPNALPIWARSASP